MSLARCSVILSVLTPGSDGCLSLGDVGRGSTAHGDLGHLLSPANSSFVNSVAPFLILYKASSFLPASLSLPGTDEKPCGLHTHGIACFLGSASCSFAMLTPQPPCLSPCHLSRGWGTTSVLPEYPMKSTHTLLLLTAFSAFSLPGISPKSLPFLCFFYTSRLASLALGLGSDFPGNRRGFDCCS